MMTQNISTLMDGEFCGEEAESLLGKIKRDPQARQDWLNYHLIGDIMRQPDYIPADINATFFERLHAEPTVLAPSRLRSSRAGLFAMSAAASIMAMAFLAWISLQIDTGPVIQQAQHSGAVRADYLPISANLPAADTMNDYMLAHHEFSPSTNVRGAASYIRTVVPMHAMAGQ